MLMDRVALRFEARNNVWILSSCLLPFFTFASRGAEDLLHYPW
jgi:hypothetical protein